VISANLIQRVAWVWSVSAGDSESQKSLLLSHGKASERLREVLADLATRMIMIIVLF